MSKQRDEGGVMVMEKVMEKPALLDTQTGQPWSECFIDAEAIQAWAARQPVPWTTSRGHEIKEKMSFSEEFLSELNRAIIDNMYDAIARKKSAMRQGFLKPGDPTALELS